MRWWAGRQEGAREGWRTAVELEKWAVMQECCAVGRGPLSHTVWVLASHPYWHLVCISLRYPAITPPLELTAVQQGSRAGRHNIQWLLCHMHRMALSSGVLFFTLRVNLHIISLCVAWPICCEADSRQLQQVAKVKCIFLTAVQPQHMFTKTTKAKYT